MSPSNPSSKLGVQGLVVSALIEQKSVTAPFDEDTILVERFLSGDSQAFEAIYRKYYDKVSSIARGVLIDHEEAADAVQEVFALVYRNLHRFDRRSRFGTWLFRIAINRSIQEARRNRNHKRSVELNESIGGVVNPADNLPDPTIQAALAKLQPADRALLVLFYWEEMSLQEIARTLGCGPNAAKTRLYRARERFRQHYEGDAR